MIILKKRKIDGYINLYSHCINCGCKTFESIDEEELTDVLKV